MLSKSSRECDGMPVLLVMIRTCITAVSVVTAMVLSSHAGAQSSHSSTYERFVLDRCPIIEKTERSVTRRCAMKQGPHFVFNLHEHGVDTFLEPAYSEGLYTPDGLYRVSRSGHFGDLVANQQGLTTIEWRVENVKGKWRPFAAIYRTAYGSGEISRQRLEIIKFGPDHACQIGVVDVTEKNPNARAREIADAALGTDACADGTAE